MPRGAGYLRTVPRSPLSRLNARGSRTVSRILSAAARLFGSSGYEASSMTEVAREAGVSKGLLHYHFTSKQHLLIEAQRAMLRQLKHRFDDRLEQNPKRGLEPAVEALDSMWEALVEMRAFAPFMVETFGLSRQNSAVAQDLDGFYEESMSLLEVGIREVFADHLDELRWPPERLAWIIRVFLHGAIIELARAESDEDFARLERTWLDCREVFLTTALRRP